jgi:TonB-linked SusC/RagA family outer membrane protein
MQLTGIIMLACCLQVSAAAFGQKITIQHKDLTLREVFRDIRRQTGYNFLYSDKTIPGGDRVSLDVRDADVQQVLNMAFAGKPLTYTIENKVIIVKSKPAAAAPVTAAPQRELSGVVQDSASGQPLAGVTIQIKGENAGTLSDNNGIFHLEVPADGGVTIVLTTVGYKRLEIPVSGQSFLNVKLAPSSHQLSDLVVVGYGTQREEKVLGAIQSIKPSQLTNTSSNLTTAFAGNIAGIIANQSNGEPGYDGATFYIRGVQTFGSNKSPLLIMDGVEISSAMLDNIPPESIESFSILKDATATALYGSRGANGVIIITTKEGHPSEKMAITLRFDNTVSMPTFIQKIGDGVDYMTAYNEAVKNNTPAGQTYVPFYSEDKIDGTRKHLNPYLFPDNNWYHTLFKDYTMNQNFNFNMSGGTRKVDYFLNFSFYNENGIIKKPSDARYDVNLNSQKYLFQSNVNASLTPTTKVALKMNTQLWYDNRPYEDITNLFYYSMRANPVRFPATLPAQEGDDFVRYGNNNSWDVGPIDLNPYALLSRGYAKRYYSWLTSVLTVDQDLKSITKGLHAKVLASFYNYTYSGDYRYFTPFYFKVDDNYTVNPDGTYNYTTEPIGDPGNTYLSSTVTRDGYHEYSLQGLVDYSRSFGKHDVGGMVVYRINEKDLNTPSASENDILPFREEGLAGRLTYDYDTRYLMEANFGYNGSENFISGKRFGFFPSLAVGYVISNEAYFKRFKRIFNLLKIRASYGLAGNDALPMRFPYLTTVTMGQNTGFYRGVNFSRS